LFADVVGSTGLGERLTPDEVKALIGECVSRMSRAVEEFGGVVQAYMGDGICALYGIPAAREDDPERAGRAALKIIDVVGEYGRDIQAAWGISDFSVRVGINSGPTAVGLVGAGDPQLVALGDTTNVAARLQSVAEPGTVAVGETTAKSIAHRFALEPLGGVAVKGREEPVETWRLTGLRDAADTSQLSPLVGRDMEMSRLEALAKQLATGRGGVLLMAGETGMGKTRLLNEFRTQVADGALWLEGQCLSYGGEVSYLPFVEMLREWLGVEEGDAEVAVRTKLRAKLSGLLGWRMDRVLPFLGRLLSVKLDPDAEEQLSALSRGARAAEIRHAYTTWVEALAYEKPVVLALDDLHWADSSTRELAEELLALTDRAPVLLFAALRPEPTSQGWAFRVKVLADYPHRVMELPLRPLTNEPAEELSRALLPKEAFEPSVTKAILARAEGNPLYIEELLRALVESGGLENRRQWTMSMSAASIIPAALENLLVARIDNLPAGARRLAQYAAVMGRNFLARVLEVVYASPDMEDNLALLLRAQIVREVRRYPELEFTFGHGMLQEAALSTLTLEARRDLYTKIAAAYEDLFAESLDDRLESLAFYYYRSNEKAKALHYLERAAVKAATLDETARARDLYERALKVAKRLGNAEAASRILKESAEAAG
jgi:predicted ATPase/class 3 adenylate cyclase